MEGSERNCRGDGCKCQVERPGEYCTEKCQASNDNAHCQCGHVACRQDDDNVREAAREATRGDPKVV